MNVSIIGSGHVGAALAGHFSRSGISVRIANTRNPTSMAVLANEIGEMVNPVTLENAIKAEIVILAVPFRAHAEVAKAGVDWHGKIVIDAMNTYGVPPEELQGKPSSSIVATAFPGAKVVKTFNQLPAKLLAKDPAEAGGRRVMFVASNDPPAAETVMKLVGELGFAPVSVGRLDEGGLLLDKSGSLVLQNMLKLA